MDLAVVDDDGSFFVFIAVPCHSDSKSKVTTTLRATGVV